MNHCEHLLTHNEAREFLRSGELPENFRDRLELFLEFETCTNCGGVQDMNFVLRHWEGNEPSWCPDCVEEGTNPRFAELAKG